jgi:CHASE1-domain containing sensor protein
MKFNAKVFIIGWLIAGAIFHSYYQQHMERDQLRLESLALEYTRRIDNQFQIHRRALEGAAGLFTAIENVTRDEWRIFTETLDLKTEFKARLGVGYIVPINKKDLANYIDKQRRAYPDFKYKKFGVQNSDSKFLDLNESFIIQYLEPQELKDAIGLDLATEKSRYEAAIHSRDANHATLTKNISFRVSKNKDVGFLFFVPAYKPKMPINTVEERRSAHKGWAYAPLLLKDLVAAAMAESTSELDYEVYLKTGSNRKLLLATSNGYFSNDPRYKFLSTENKIGEQDFIFHWRPNSNFISSRDFTLAWVGAIAVLLSLSMAWGLAAVHDTLSKS